MKKSKRIVILRIVASLYRRKTREKFASLYREIKGVSVLPVDDTTMWTFPDLFIQRTREPVNDVFWREQKEPINKQHTVQQGNDLAISVIL